MLNLSSTLANHSNFHLEFFQAFKFCTMHIFWSKNVDTKLQTDFLRLIWLLGSPNFYVIQTENSEVNLNYTSYDEIFNCTVGTQSDLQFNSLMYKNIFRPFKHSTPSILQLPVLQGLEVKNLQTFLTDAGMYLEIVEPKEHLYLANFVVLPLSPLKYNTQQLKFSHLTYLKSNIIILDQTNYKIHKPCFPIIGDCWSQDELIWIPIKLDIFLANIHSLWVNPFKQSDATMIVLNYWYPIQACPYNGNPKMLVDKPFLPDIEVCVKHIIAASINCTSSSCSKHIRNYHKFSSIESPTKHIREFLPIGARVHGFKYLIFINKHTSKMASADLNAFLLLSPFSILGWSIILITVFILSLILGMTVKSGGMYLWIYAILLEQDFMSKMQINVHNCSIVILWMYSCHLLRSQYTSSLYTYMTLSSDPYDIPSSFNELVNHNNMILMMSETGWRTFENTGTTINSLTTNNQKLQKLWSKASDKLWVYNHNWRNYLKLGYPSKDQQEKYLCNIAYGYGVKRGRFLTGSNNLNEWHIAATQKINYTNSSYCATCNRFAWLYRPNEKRNGYKSPMHFKILMTLFNEFILFEKDDAVVFPVVYLWSSLQLSYLGETFSRKLSSLVESGVYEYQTNYKDLMTQRFTLDHLIEELGIKRAWSWFGFISELVSNRKIFSKYGSRTVFEYLNNANLTVEYNIVGKMNDFRYVWLCYSMGVVTLFMVFLFELGLHLRKNIK